MAENLRTINEVAAQLQLSRSSVIRLIHSGELASVKFERARRIPASSVDRLIARKLTDTAA